MRGLLSLVLDSILGSGLFGGDSDSDSSGERVLGSRGMKELTDLDVLTERDWTLLRSVIISRKSFESFGLQRVLRDVVWRGHWAGGSRQFVCEDTLTFVRYVVRYFDSLTSYLWKTRWQAHVTLCFGFDGCTSADGDRDDDELLLVVIEKKVERCKVVELFKARRKSIGLKILFPTGLLLSEAKPWPN
jgi:hypothetical protein